MDINKLSDADKYMLYGLLLKKKRPPEAELRVLEIMRSPLGLDRKIDAILRLHRELPGGAEEEVAQLVQPSPVPRKRRLRAVVADPYPEVTGMLARCSLRGFLEFVQAENAKQALYLVRKLRARLLVCNLPLAPAERSSFFLDCRKRQPRLKVIFLRAEAADDGELATEPDARMLPKPINLNQVSEAVRELLEPRG
jgi:hypothetical protein